MLGAILEFVIQRRGDIAFVVLLHLLLGGLYTFMFYNLSHTFCAE
jgi:hypothetical protein